MAVTGQQAISLRRVRRCRWFALGGMLALMLTMPSLSFAASDDEPYWGFSLVFGGHLPQLSAIDDGLFQSDLIGDATVLIREGGNTTSGDSQVIDTNKSEIIPFIYSNRIQPVKVGAYGAFEFAWHATPENALIFGLGSWEKTSLNVTQGNLPLQQYYVRNIVDSERRGRISYTEYTFGWRHDFRTEGKLKLYSRLSLHELFDVDYREDYVFRFAFTPIPDLQGVRRDLVVQAQTASVFMAQLGGGAEWMLADWLSLGLEGGYMLGDRDFELKDVKYTNDLADNDQADITGLPAVKLGNGTLGYLSPTATPESLRDATTRLNNYRPIRLRFEGFRFALRLTMYF